MDKKSKKVITVDSYEEISKEEKELFKNAALSCLNNGLTSEIAIRRAAKTVIGYRRLKNIVREIEFDITESLD